MKTQPSSFFHELVNVYKVQRFMLVVLGLVLMGASLISVVESGHPGANILTFRDGLWWALVTVTSTGYGDFYPITGLGRIIGAMLMFSGISLFASIPALIASYFTYRRFKHNYRRQNHMIEDLDKQIKQIELKVDYLIREIAPFTSKKKPKQVPKNK